MYDPVSPNRAGADPVFIDLLGSVLMVIRAKTLNRVTRGSRRASARTSSAAAAATSDGYDASPHGYDEP